MAYTNERFINGLNPEVRITFSRGRGDRGEEFVMPIGLFAEYECMAPIDIPSPDAGVAVMFCTPDAHRKLRQRQQIIADVSREIAKYLADAIGAKDTLMGYPKEPA